MTIETTRAPEAAKPASSAANRGTSAATRPGAAGAPAGAGGGFADLMSLLSASDEPVDATLVSTDAGLAGADTTESKEQNMPLAPDGQGLIAINVIPIGSPVLSPPVAAAVPEDAANLVAAGSGPATVARAGGKGGVGAQPAADQADASLATSAQDLSASTASAATDVATLLDHRRASQSHAAIQTQMELRQASLQPASQPALAAVDASRAAPNMVAADVLTASTDRRESRPGIGSVRSGLEGASGGTVADRLGLSPTYEVAATSAVVPEGQVAETVSYWASHGVQSAELTLDGLGDEPVEVRISVEGDQAQIDFRSNQPDVRQALEGASAQLKALLSGEGLQLTGMSVGTSNRGAGQGEGGQPRPSPRQAKLVSLEPARAATARAANPAVGQALDLYV